jgi:hypothetical protein
MTAPPVWTSEELERERLRAIEVFRRERMEEPLEDYLESFDRYQGFVEELLETTIDLSEWDMAALEVLTEPNLLEAFRYIAAPPISEDDLQVLAEATSLSKARLMARPGDVQKLLGVVRSVLDRRRFAWVVERREPTESEKGAAIMASAALMAASRVQTNRRTLNKKRQGALVMDSLAGLGLKKVKARPVKTFAQAPALGEFCSECAVGGRKADIVVRLWDDRIMPIECKVSNSALNSMKRLNNDAAVKAVVWKNEFGLRQIVPTAVLGGVYNLANLLDAQDKGLSLIWAHDLSPLGRWISSTRPSV